MTTHQTDRFASGNPSVEPINKPSGVSECMQHPQQAFEDAVQKRPATTIMTFFGVGLGVGALIGCAIAQSTSRTRQMENWRERMMGSMSGAVPDSVKHYFKG